MLSRIFSVQRWKLLYKAMELQDPVPWVGKLGVLYARPGQRVLVIREVTCKCAPPP